MKFEYKNNRKTRALFGFIFLFFMVPSIVFGQKTYSPFVTIPGFDYATVTFSGLVNALYLLLIGIGATYGVLKIAFAGVRYAMSDVVTSKQDAMHDITGVFKGLAILLLPAIVLGTINKDLLNLDIFAKFGSSVNVDMGAYSKSGTATPIKNGEICGVSATTCTTACTNGYVRASDGVNFVCSNTSIINAGNATEATDAGIKACVDGGGLVQRAGLPAGQFKCISKPSKPFNCNTGDVACLEKCGLAGGQQSADQGGYWICT